MPCDFCRSGHDVVECSSDIAHLPEEEKCKSNEKCYGWYSTEHHALFCRERARGLRMFIPQIDKDLLPRFLELLELDEKYLIGLSSSVAKKILPLEPIKVMSAFKQQIIEKCTGAEVIFLNSTLELDHFEPKHECRRERRCYRNFCEKIGTKTLFGSLRIIKFFESNLPAETFLQLLSHHTKELRISDGTFTPYLEFSDIIQKAPNLEILTIYDYYDRSDVTYEKPWMDALLEYKNGQNMRHLAIQPETIELDIGNLVKFITTKCAKDVRIDIQFDVPKGRLHRSERKEMLAGIWEKVGKYYHRGAKSGCARLEIGLYRTELEKVFSLKKLKSDNQSNIPTRVATKRTHSQTK